jgi:CMP-N,N'-diacetyllegionaminic acid synthase
MPSPTTLAVISARGGSKGIPRKNIRTLGGLPLMAHMIRAARAAKRIDRVIVSTDDAEIAECAKSFGADVPFTRSADLAGDRVPLVQATKDAMEQMDRLGYRADIILQLSPTCPFVGPDRLDESVKLILDGADSAVAVKRIEHEHPYRAKQVEADGCFTPFVKGIDVETAFQSRQDLPELYCTCGAIYTRRRELLDRWTAGFAFGNRPMPVFLRDVEAINIDRPIDFAFAEFIMRERARLERDNMIPPLSWPPASADTQGHSGGA